MNGLVKLLKYLQREVKKDFPESPFTVFVL